MANCVETLMFLYEVRWKASFPLCNSSTCLFSNSTLNFNRFIKIARTKVLFVCFMSLKATSHVLFVLLSPTDLVYPPSLVACLDFCWLLFRQSLAFLGFLFWLMEPQTFFFAYFLYANFTRNLQRVKSQSESYLKKMRRNIEEPYGIFHLKFTL